MRFSFEASNCFFDFFKFVNWSSLISIMIEFKSSWAWASSSSSRLVFEAFSWIFSSITLSCFCYTILFLKHELVFQPEIFTIHFQNELSFCNQLLIVVNNWVLSWIIFSNLIKKIIWNALNVFDCINITLGIRLVFLSK